MMHITKSLIGEKLEGNRWYDPFMPILWYDTTYALRSCC